VDLKLVEAGEILDGGVGKRLGAVELPQDTRGSAAIPLAVVQGARPGPTLWINAALHGDEYLGPATIVRLLRDLNPPDVRGRLILTPSLNPGALRAMQRADPVEPVDLNRTWSSGANASRESRVRGWADKELLERSDFVLDLHSGGNRFLQESFAVYPRTAGAVDGASSALAKACGLPWIWAHHGSILEGALITAAARKGKPAVLLEMGGEGKAETASIDAMAGAIDGALAHAQIGAGAPRFLRSYHVFDGFLVLRNRTEGLWRRAIEPAASVHSGGALGRVMDLLGRELEVVTSPVDGVVVGICTYGFVPPEDYVAELAHEFHKEGPPS
jgi:predicted deacylase